MSNKQKINAAKAVKELYGDYQDVVLRLVDPRYYFEYKTAEEAQKMLELLCKQAAAEIILLRHAVGAPAWLLHEQDIAGD